MLNDSIPIYTIFNFNFFKNQEEKFHQNLFKKNSEKPSFFYLDALHGGGKTNSIIESITSSALSHGGIYYYVAPTFKLGSQTYNQFIVDGKLDPSNVFMCFKEDVSNQNNPLLDPDHKSMSATEKVINAVTLSKSKDYSVIILSQKSFLESEDVQKIMIKINGHLIIDEIPDFVHNSHFSVGCQTRDFINSIFEVKNTFNDLYIIGLRDDCELDKYDTLLTTHFKKEINIAKRNGLLLVKKLQWNRLIGIPDNIPLEDTVAQKDKNKVKIKDRNNLTFVSIESPELFKKFYSTTFFSADCGYNPVFGTWSILYDIDFKLSEDFKQFLRYYGVDETNITSRIEVAYGMEDNFSKSSRFKDLNGKTLYKHLKTSAKQFVSGSSKTLLVRNDDTKKGDMLDLVETYTENGEDISIHSHGSNNYMEADSIIVLAAINHHPVTASILKSLGWSNDDLDYFYVSSVVQAIMRTALRDPNSTKKVKVFVSDYRAVIRLQKFFGNDISINHSYALKSTKEHKMTEKQVYSMNKKNDLLEFFSGSFYNEGYQEKNSRTNNDQKTIEFSTIKNIKDNIPQKHSLTTAEFLKTLKGMSKHYSVENKTDALLYSNFIFDNNSRLKKDALTTNFAVFDFDNSSLNIEEMTKIFQKEYGKSLFSITTYSSDRNNPYHYRILAFFKQTITANYLYEFYGHTEHFLSTKYNLITSSNKERNPNKLYTGIDRSKYNESSFFFAPSFKEEEGKLSWIQPAKTYTELEDNKLDVISILESSEFVKELRLEKKRQEEIKLEQQKRLEERKKSNEKKLEDFNKLRSFVNSKPIDINSKQDQVIFDAFNNKLTKNMLYEKLMNQIEELEPNNRSSRACSIAGSARFIEDHNLKHELFNAMIGKGIDKSAQKSVKNYMRL